MDYLIHLCIQICIYTILAQSLSLIVGHSKQISLAHAGFYGIGAYSASLLTIYWDISFLIVLPLIVFFVGTFAYITSTIIIKIVDDYYVVVTLGIQIVLYSIMNNWQDMTGGPFGITNIPPLNILGFNIESNLSFLLLSFIFLILIWNTLKRITNSPFGQILNALSEDEVFCKSLGKDVNKAKIISFTISSTIASLAGVLYAHYTGYIDPSSFTIDESIFILSIVIIGGMKNSIFIFYATTFLILLPEILRFSGIPSALAPNIRQIIYGLAMIIFIVWQPAFNMKKNL